MPAKIVCLVGISGSGKSTLARSLSEEYGSTNCIVVNRDKLREMCYSYTEKSVVDHYSHPDFSKRENEVSNVQNRIIRGALSDGKIVIVDNTNLKLRFLNEYKKFGVPVEFKLVDTNLGVCLLRDQERERKVGAEIIRKQFNDLNSLKKVFDFKSWVPEVWKKPDYDHKKKDAVIVDLDGTLCLNRSGRSPFEWHRVGEDHLNDSVWKAIHCLKKEVDIIICSGRDEICRPETEKWLSDYYVEYVKLFMRKNQDNRQDSLVKLEFWQQISDTWNILWCIDDRNQVVDFGRQCNLEMWQVNYGDF